MRRLFSHSVSVSQRGKGAGDSEDRVRDRSVCLRVDALNVRFRHQGTHSRRLFVGLFGGALFGRIERIIYPIHVRPAAMRRNCAGSSCASGDTDVGRFPPAYSVGHRAQRVHTGRELNYPANHDRPFASRRPIIFCERGLSPFIADGLRVRQHRRSSSARQFHDCRRECRAHLRFDAGVLILTVGLKASCCCRIFGCLHALIGNVSGYGAELLRRPVRWLAESLKLELHTGGENAGEIGTARPVVSSGVDSPGISGRHRRVIGRRYYRERLTRYDSKLEPRCRTYFRLHRCRGTRETHFHVGPARSRR